MHQVDAGHALGQRLASTRPAQTTAWPSAVTSWQPRMTRRSSSSCWKRTSLAALIATCWQGLRDAIACSTISTVWSSVTASIQQPRTSPAVRHPFRGPPRVPDRRLLPSASLPPRCLTARPCRTLRMLGRKRLCDDPRPAGPGLPNGEEKGGRHLAADGHQALGQAEDALAMDLRVREEPRRSRADRRLTSSQWPLGRHREKSGCSAPSGHGAAGTGRAETGSAARSGSSDSASVRSSAARPGGSRSRTRAAAPSGRARSSSWRRPMPNSPSANWSLVPSPTCTLTLGAASHSLASGSRSTATIGFAVLKRSTRRPSRRRRRGSARRARRGTARGTAGSGARATAARCRWSPPSDLVRA